MKRLEKVAMITGAGGGIGSVIAKRFAEEGAKVALVDRDIKKLSAVHKEITKSGGQAEVFSVNITDSKDVAKVVKQIVKALGDIQLLVNSVGLLIQGKVDEMPEKDFDALMAVNVKGVFLTYKYVVPSMRKAGGGVIINRPLAQIISKRVRSYKYQR